MDYRQDLHKILTRTFGRNDYWKYLAVGLAGLILILIFKNLILLGLLLALTVVVSFFGRHVGVANYGVELSTLVTVLSGFTLGPQYGIAVGLLSMTVHLVLAMKYLGLYIVWVIPTYGVIGLIAGLIPGTSITSLGIGLNIGSQLLFSLCTVMFNPGNLGRYIPYLVSNLIFNFILFTYVAPYLVPLIG